MLVCPKLLKTVIVSQDLSVFSTQFIQQQSSFKEPETFIYLTFIFLPSHSLTLHLTLQSDFLKEQASSETFVSNYSSAAQALVLSCPLNGVSSLTEKKRVFIDDPSPITRADRR